MRVKNLQNEFVNWQIAQYAMNPNSQSKSQFQGRVGRILKGIFPSDVIIEEVPLPEASMSLDFFVPSMKLAIECDGRQHTEHVKFFHKTQQEFLAQQKRDRDKESWCSINGFRMVRIYPDMSDAEIVTAITEQ